MHIYTINTCGCANGNPGEAAIGVEIYDHKKNEIMLSYVTHIGFKTSHYAQHTAIITGIYWLRSLRSEEFGTVVLKSNNLWTLKTLKKDFVPHNINELKQLDHLYLMESHFLKGFNYEISEHQEDGLLKRMVVGATLRNGYPVNKLLLNIFKYFNVDLSVDYKGNAVKLINYIDKWNEFIDFVDKTMGDPLKVSLLEITVFKSYDIEKHLLVLELDQSVIFFKDGLVDLFSHDIVRNKLHDLFNDSQLTIRFQ